MVHLSITECNDSLRRKVRECHRAKDNGESHIAVTLPVDSSITQRGWRPAHMLPIEPDGYLPQRGTGKGLSGVSIIIVRKSTCQPGNKE